FYLHILIYKNYYTHCSLNNYRTIQSLFLTYQNQFYLLPYIYLPNNLDQKPLFFSSKSFFSISCIFVSFSFRTSVFAFMCFVLVASICKRLYRSVLAKCCYCDSSLCISETLYSFDSSFGCNSCT